MFQMTAAQACLVVMTSSSAAHVSSALNLLSCLPRQLSDMFLMQLSQIIQIPSKV